VSIEYTKESESNRRYKQAKIIKHIPTVTAKCGSHSIEYAKMLHNRRRARTADYECRVATGMAMTGSGDNDTPIQSQSERDKTVAGNEGGSAKVQER